MSLNPNKTHGCDNISIQMLQLCAESIHMPLGIIFRNNVKTGIFPDQWKLTNVTPIHKKNDKQLVSNYRPISLLYPSVLHLPVIPICSPSPCYTYLFPISLLYLSVLHLPVIPICSPSPCYTYLF